MFLCYSMWDSSQLHFMSLDTASWQISPSSFQTFHLSIKMGYSYIQLLGYNISEKKWWLESIHSKRKKSHMPSSMWMEAVNLTGKTTVLKETHCTHSLLLMSSYPSCYEPPCYFYSLWTCMYRLNYKNSHEIHRPKDHAIPWLEMLTSLLRSLVISSAFLLCLQKCLMFFCCFLSRRFI